MCGKGSIITQLLLKMQPPGIDFHCSMWRFCHMTYVNLFRTLQLNHRQCSINASCTCTRSQNNSWGLVFLLSLHRACLPGKVLYIRTSSVPKGGRRARLSLSQGTVALCLLCNKIWKSLWDAVPGWLCRARVDFTLAVMVWVICRNLPTQGLGAVTLCAQSCSSPPQERRLSQDSEIFFNYSATTWAPISSPAALQRESGRT